MGDSKQGLLSSVYFKSLIAGGISGTCVDISLYPLDTLKTRLQSSRGFFPSGGFTSVYRGIGSVALGSAPSAALFFTTYESLKSHNFSPAVASSLGEVAACAVRVPVEVVKQRAQAAAGGVVGSRHALRYVVGLGRDKGWIGVGRELYRGWGITVMREIPFSIIQFPLWEFFKSNVAQAQGRRVTGFESSACGSLAACIAAAATTPLDVLKTRVMLADRKVGVVTMASKILKEEGWKVMFRGIVPRMVWISAGGAVFLGTFTGVVNVLNDLA